MVACTTTGNPRDSLIKRSGQTSTYPPPPCPRTTLRKNQPLVPRSNSRITFFYQVSGFFMFLVDVGQLFRCAGHHFMCVTTGPPIRGNPISHSQAHIPQTLGMSLTLMTLLTLTGQVMVLLRMTNVWISSGQRQPGSVWGLAHVFNNKLFFTRDIMDDDAVPMHFNVPEPKPKPKPKPAPKATAAPKPGPKGQHRQEFRMVYHRKKGFTSQPVEQ